MDNYSLENAQTDIEIYVWVSFGGVAGKGKSWCWGNASLPACDWLSKRAVQGWICGSAQVLKRLIFNS